MKKFKIKIFFYTIIILFSCYFTYKRLVQTDLNLTNQEFLELLISDSAIKNGNLSPKEIASKITQIMTNINFDDSSSYLDVPKSLAVTQDGKKTVIPNIINVNKQEDTLPLVYIYNTHQAESYSQGALAPYNIIPNVQMASYILQEKLKEDKIVSIVEETNIKKMLAKEKLDYSGSYKITRNLLKNAMKKYESINYFIDIHRDSIGKKQGTATINKKNYAKLMFVIALNNKNYKENLKLMNALNDKLEKDYPGISRGIYKRNAIYNQDLDSNVILIEVGGDKNTIEEVYNSMEAFSNVLSWYIGVQNG